MPATARKRDPLQTTTVRLPRKVYDEARYVVESGVIEANTLNDLLVDSLREKLEQVRRERIDAEFAEMRNDPQYRREAERIAEQFATNDSETLSFAGKAHK